MEEGADDSVAANMDSEMIGMGQMPAEMPNMAPMDDAMPMEEDLIATTSRVFYIDDSSSLLEKADIRGAMMLKYMTKLPEVTACNMRADQALADD